MRLNYGIENIPGDGRSSNQRMGRNKKILFEFVDSGVRFAEVAVERGEVLDHKRSALGTLARKTHAPVMVVSRSSRLYLMRTDAKEATS